MKKGVVIADSGPIISLVLVNRLDILDAIFSDIRIPQAVWEEITANPSLPFFNKLSTYFKDKTLNIKGFNELTFIMGYGESESVILYNELQADFLLIDDKKARNIAENFGITCIGTLGLLAIAKDKGVIEELKPIFEKFIANKRFYSLNLLNSILIKKKEPIISI